MNPLFVSGKFQLAYGSMKSGKSEIIVDSVKKLQLSNSLGQSTSYQLFKPSIDSRDGPYIVSRGNGEAKPARYGAQFIDYNNPRSLLDKLESTTKVVGIDELQFFSAGIVNTIEELLERNFFVIGAGLDLDYARQPFGAMPQLINLATHPVHTYAFCDVCGDPAFLTQRLNPDKTPSSTSGEQVAVDQITTSGKQRTKQLDYLYEARCFTHHQLPDGPFKNM